MGQASTVRVRYPDLPNVGLATAGARDMQRFILVVLPFAAAYFVSYFFRTINALISASLVNSFNLDASKLGLLTSVYFAAFAVVQIPAGFYLDRYGPRRVQGVLLIVAGGGAAVFGTATNVESLLLGRAMIGFGVAASLVAGLKAITLWFPKERIALVNGCFIMLGTLGVVAATAPADLVQQFVSWRALFEILATLCMLLALLITAVAPELPSKPRPKNKLLTQIKSIYADPRFWRLAPLSMMCISTSWALQGLWAAPWFLDVDRLDEKSVVRLLFIMSISLSAAALLFGIITDQLSRRGIKPQAILRSVATGFIAMQAALFFHLPIAAVVIWGFIAATGAATVVSYSILAEYFPKEISGQANAAFNTLQIGGAFVIQAGIGLIVSHWTARGGHYPPIAYKVAIGVILIGQVLALTWFLVPERTGRKSVAAAGPRAVGSN